jgi:DNA replication protein DnaC
MITTSSREPLAYQIPFRSELASLDDLATGLEKQLRSAHAGKMGAVLSGPTGVGKTCAMVLAMKWASPTVRGEVTFFPFFVAWPEFIRDTKQFEDDFKDAPDRRFFDPRRRLGTYPAALFLDNVGEEREVTSGYEVGKAEVIFAELIDRRVGMAVPLWITTNLSERELRARYGEPTVSRLREHCAFITLTGKDRRLA